ncbi:hypothetical protein WR25_10045 [Diploscapter pachys]|uniref:Uncharacterized protein n=1 Tax=Diploscapter pachys TaxID=2018661 RepID=A0A2A2JAG2_9BILA|nr:hypothetical protein WR25_10045 [Diploscapter pachys]
MPHKGVTISVLGLSGKEKIKGAQGVGKSLLCNRFIRGEQDAFRHEHSSVLSQTDFAGSPCINSQHWLFWGLRQLECNEAGENVTIRLAEQTEFLDDETFEPIASTSMQSYAQRACRVRLTSKDKLMYIEKEQLGLESEYEQIPLPDGKLDIDCFVYVFDLSVVEGRTFESQFNFALAVLKNCLKTKKPIVIALSKCDVADEAGRRSAQNLLLRKELKAAHIPMVETSALKNVNVEELFLTAYLLAIKGKSRLKLMAYAEAVKEVDESNRQTNLKLNSRLEDQPQYRRFVQIYGSHAARRIYEEHINEAKEHWMAARLKVSANHLPRIFSILLEKNDVIGMSWSTAKGIILSHPLFDQFFQPLGALGRQLDPLPSNFESNEEMEQQQGDSRVPAELLLTGEAKTAFDNYQASYWE